MRIPFPVHIPLWGATGFAVLLFAVQLEQGTAIPFAICSFLFILVSTVAFNLAGGFSRPSGAYVFFYAVLGIILGLFWKAVVGERGDSNLLMPQLTIEVYLGGITAMLGAVFISRRLTPRRALLQDLVTDTNLQNATVGCMVTGLALTILLSVTERTNGSLLSAIAQVNRFLPMAMILGVIHEIRKSGGTRSFNPAVLISGGVIFAIGVMGFSKEGIFTPVLCWLIAAGSQRYKVSITQIVCASVVIALMVLYLVPFAQYGRDAVDKEQSFSDRIAPTFELLTHLGEVRKKNNILSEGEHSESKMYFDTPQGFAERLQMIAPDDSLIELTERKGTFGYSPIIAGFENLVPHFLWPNKPVIAYGNLFAHEMGGLPEDDTTTGISFSPSGEAYHIAKWVGIFILAPALWVLLFTIFDGLCGDTRISPWGLLMIATFSHIAPEGMLDSVIYMFGYGTFGVILAALSAAYVMPIIGTLAKGPEKTILVRTGPIRSFPRRAANRPPEEMAH